MTFFSSNLVFFLHFESLNVFSKFLFHAQHRSSGYVISAVSFAIEKRYVCSNSSGFSVDIFPFRGRIRDPCAFYSITTLPSTNFRIKYFI